MNIACLGWGSLIWKPDSLPTQGAWHEDGPQLPIELSRVGDGGELATAISMNAPASPVLWVWLNVATVADACEALREREQIPAERSGGIGSLLVGDDDPGPLARWGRAKGIHAVVWTALPPRFDGIEGRIPSGNDAVAYLANLTGEERDHARSYIEQIPEQIDTPYRRVIAQRLGWGPGANTK